MLTETEEMQAGGEERMLGLAGHELEDGGGRRNANGERCMHKAAGVLQELRVFHSERVTRWREALRECACMLNKCPPEGVDQQHPSTKEPRCKDLLCSDSFPDAFQSVVEDIENIMQKLSTIISKLDAEIHQVSAEEASGVEAAHQETTNTRTKAQTEDENNPPGTHDSHKSDSTGRKQEAEDGSDESRTRLSPDTEQTTHFTSTTSRHNKVIETGTELEVKGQVRDREDCVSQEGRKDLLKETGNDSEKRKVKGKEETKSEWITVGLAGKMEDSQSRVADACFVGAPVGAADLLTCEMADDLSGLMVSGSEELVSRVIRVKVQGSAKFHFPVMVAVPFRARYRGNYRDVAVKILAEGRRVSYVAPVTTEGTYGGQRGLFAEVRVYTLGLFAVVSCLKRENYTVPKKGLSLKLPMDPRICLNYLPGAFAPPVMAQTMVQPVDTAVLAAVKSRNEPYYSVASTSPLVYLTHPKSQALRRPLTLTLPCPPNPEKKRDTRGRGTHTGPVASTWDRAASHRVSASLHSTKEMCQELLVVLGSRDKQWSVLEQVTVRNQQNGLVSFELSENVDRLLVVRLLSPLQPCHLASLAEDLEDSVGLHAVTVVLLGRVDDPRGVLVSALPRRDLSWELNKLRAQGYSGLPETSADVNICEGDQLLLRFSGNITSTSALDNQNYVAHERLTFHTQRRNHLLVRLTEVDPFGNYSSPHYKGAAMFYKVTRGQPEHGGDADFLGDPECTLPLTLPKRVRNINRPIIARVRLCEQTDSLSDSLLLWLAGELSQEEVAALVLSLRLRRSTTQLLRLRAGSSPSIQAFHILATWRKGQPAAPCQPRASQLARCLAKSGRPDLARELLLRQAAATTQIP